MASYAEGKTVSTNSTKHHAPKNSRAKTQTRRAMGRLGSEIYAPGCQGSEGREAHLRSKWSWAGHVARMNGDRIALRAMEWRDANWQATGHELPISLRMRRPQRKRWSKWEDELRDFAAHNGWDSWQHVALLRDSPGKAAEWNAHCRKFADLLKKRLSREGASSPQGALHQPYLLRPSLSLGP